MQEIQFSKKKASLKNVYGCLKCVFIPDMKRIQYRIFTQSSEMFSSYVLYPMKRFKHNKTQEIFFVQVLVAAVAP